MRTLLLTLVLLAGGCGSSVVVYDVFQPDDDPKADALHTYASHAQVPLRVRATSPFTTLTDLSPKASGAVTLDAKTDVAVKDDVMSFAVITGDAGAGTVAIVDPSGNVLTTESSAGADADSIALSVTPPSTQGVQ